MLVSASSAGLDERTVSAVFGNPASVAVVGASGDPAKWGHWLAKGAQLGERRRPVYFVNRSGAEVLGYPSYPTLSELPAVPELVAIAVPGHLVAGVIREALELGSRAFVVVAASMDEEAETAALLREYGARMIGPNSLGIYAAEGELQLMWGSMRPGSLAIVSQSGQLGSEIAAIGDRSGVGVSRFVSLGNQTDMGAAEVVRSIIGDGPTRTIGVYVEDFSDAENLFAAIREAAESGIGVIVLTTGASDASRELAQSHTGAMTSSMDLVDAACRAAGALRVRTPAELVQIASYLHRRDAPAGPRIAVISDSGGQGGIAADEAARLGLELPELSPGLRAKIEPLLTAAASSRNPIDLAGSGEARLDVYAELPKLLAESGEVDAVVVSGYFGSYGHDMAPLAGPENAVADQLAEVAAVPVVVHAMAPGSAVSQRLRESGVPVTGRIEDALLALSASQRLRSVDTAARPDGHELPAASQVEIRAALAAAGIPFPELRIVRDAGQAAAAAAELGGTVVLKAAWLAHKTEAGGVALGLRSPSEAESAFRAMHARIGDGDYTVESQDAREHVAEFIVSARRDPSFGTVVSVGAGGTETEIWGDITLDIAPVTREGASEMIGRLRSSRLLGPWRGRPALDADSLASIVAGLGNALAASPGVSEIELNPVRVGIDGALAVDCLAVLAEPQPQPQPQLRP